MLKPEQILNDTYKIIEQIGSGGGGIIYKAYHLRMRKDVAIKLIKNDINGKINNRSEVDVLKNLKNDYLPQVIDFVEDGEDVYTVMEYIDGLNFRQLIERGKHFTEKQVKKYALQLCDAVEYLHNHVPPIIHSDIKPANVMLTPQDNICLIDFNISMMIGNGKAVSIGGSQGFAAPEQFKKYIEVPVTIDDFHEETRFVDEDETEILIDETSHPIITSSHVKTKNMARAFIDIRTDIYGIGATIYYMLTERVPQNGKLDFRGINCSAKIREVIEKAMAPIPAKRYKNVAEMKSAIKSESAIKPTVKIASISLSAIIAVGMLVLLIAINMSKIVKTDVVDNKTSVSEPPNHTTVSQALPTSDESSVSITTAETFTSNTDELSEINMSVDNAIMTNGFWGQSISYSSNDIPIEKLNDNSYIEVEYEIFDEWDSNDSPIELILQCYDTNPQIWAKITPYENENKTARFSYNDMILYWGSNDLSNVNFIHVGDRGVSVKVTRFSIIFDNGILSDGTTINKNSIAEEEDREDEFIQTKELDINKFNQSLLSHINEERSSIQIYPLKENTELHKIATSLAQDISNKTYTKGTGKTYFKNKYDYCDLYYEDAFDISSYDNEDEIAAALLKYEKDNFSYLWLDEKFQYFSSDVVINSDGTWCIVFCLAGDKTNDNN